MKAFAKTFPCSECSRKESELLKTAIAPGCQAGRRKLCMFGGSRERLASTGQNGNPCRPACQQTCVKDGHRPQAKASCTQAGHAKEMSVSPQRTPKPDKDGKCFLLAVESPGSLHHPSIT